MSKILIILIAITLCAWGFLAYQHWQMFSLPMNQMWMPPNSVWHWQFFDFVMVYSMWAVMMAAMMLPSALPMVKSYSLVCRKRYHSDFPFVYLFSAAYLMVWFLFSIVLTLIQWQLHGLNWLTGMMDNANTLLASGILISAGVYQFTALKNVCLSHCRSPIGFLLNFWRNGKLGALRMGLFHGITCLGCCWVQMLIMFAVGVMNITGMIVLTSFILLEKSLSQQERLVSKLAGIVLCLWGIGLLSTELNPHWR